ncbi:TonB family protein [Rhodobacterales bacterium HKCCE3408]|nr:TonB family protein [Rhodobacterales bacterium HKCCE3408]
MIPSSRPLMVAAFGLAAAVHVAGAAVLMRPAPIEIEGRAGASTARIGASFADMVAGAPVVHAGVEATPLEPPQPEVVAETTPLRPIAPAPVVRTTAVVTPAVPDYSGTVASEPTEALRPAATIITARAADPAPLQPRDEPSESTPVQPDDAEPLAVRDAPASGLTVSPRPTRRDPAAAPGSGPVDNVRGSDQGSATAEAPAASTGTAETSEAGNAAASRYPGLVMQRLSGRPRPQVGARGAAVIVFTIGGSGALDSLALSSSSGSAELDAAALTFIRGAAPFPPPPAGAERTFSIRIEGR